jgi:exosome complex RNA-binding protein Rrp4
MKQFYNVADVRFNDGMVYIDTEGISPHGKHYNVEVFISTNGNIHIKAERAQYILQMSAFGGENHKDVDRVLPQYVKEYKPWPWSRQKSRKLHEGWCELKERTVVEYHATAYRISGPVNEQV